MNNCLIMVDFQNDYFPGGTMELVGIDKAVANGQLLLHTARKRSLPVIHIQHLAARPGATFFIPGTAGAGINSLVTPLADEPVVVKNSPNSFRDTCLLKLLQEREIDSLIVCGAMSHMCIDATVRAAFDLGFGCTVAADACATRDLSFHGKTINAAEVHAAFMAALSVPYAKISSTAEIVQNMTT